MGVSARAFLTASIVAAVCAGTAPDARADAIDGMWCEGSRSMRIDYDRHGFRYVIPPGEDGAGKTVNMILLGEYDLDVTVGEGATRRWRRCKLTS